MPSCGATPRYLRERLDLNSGLLVLSHVTVVDVAVLKTHPEAIPN
jgi:hypothetical protein